MSANPEFNRRLKESSECIISINISVHKHGDTAAGKLIRQEAQIELS